MASIIARKRGDGTTAYTAQIRLKRNGVVYHSEARTFLKKTTARDWAREREEQLKRDPSTAFRAVHAGKTVGQLIAAYLTERERIEPLGRSKGQHLRFLLGWAIASRAALALTPLQVIEHVRERRMSGAGPATVNSDLIWLRVVFRYARTALGVPVRMDALADAAEICRAERLTARSRRRLRRPTDAELQSILDWYRRRRTGPPMALILWFAIYSCRRQAEIFRMRLSDFDRARMTWLIRDLKHPDGAGGNHQVMRVPDRLLPVIDAILATVPRTDDRLLPYQSKSIGANWTRTLKVLGIADLHFHDLRREGCSRLAEAGLSIPEIQQVSLHESWSALQVYVNLRPSAVRRLEFIPAGSASPRPPAPAPDRDTGPGR